MKIAILGAGAGGASAAVELRLAGHEVRLWNRSEAAIAGFRAARGIAYSGVFGEGRVPLEVITTDLAEAARDAALLLVCLPTLAHGALAATLLDERIDSIPVLLNPGHTGGALEFAHVFRARGAQTPPVAELSTLTYVARKAGVDGVTTTGRARRLRVAAMPGGRAALDLACALYECASPVENVLVTGLSNVNLVLHPPGVVLGAAWIEATAGNFTFYVEGMTEGVARVMLQLDAERRAVAGGFGFDLPSLFDEMQAIGTIEPGAAIDAQLATAIRAGEANRRIRAPDSFRHRYFQEDLWYGLQPFIALASIAGVAVPTASALMHLGQLAAGPAAPPQGRGAELMGIAGLDKAGLLRYVTAR